MVGDREALIEQDEARGIDSKSVPICHVYQRVCHGGPAAYPIADPVGHQLREVAGSEAGITLQPSADQHQIERQVPVVDRDPWVDSDTQQLIDQSVVEIQTLRISGASATGLYSGPRDGES